VKLRPNALFLVLLAVLATGLLGGLGLRPTLETLGRSFNDSRYISLVWIVLPVIGLLERYGLKERAAAIIGGLKGATTGRLLVGYLAFRQVTAALGLISIAGHAQTVRPIVAPMAEAASGLDDEEGRERVRAHAAATDNVGVFFGEDIFLAISSILLIRAFMSENGYELEPIELSIWAIPTAIAAFLIHGSRLLLLDRRLARERRRAP
jgi:uncharacterized membrane protein